MHLLEINKAHEITSKNQVFGSQISQKLYMAHRLHGSKIKHKKPMVKKI